jgi:hypothetical protein
MSAVLSAFVTAATVLGIWTAASLLVTPVLVLGLRGQARWNARFTREASRQAWRTASLEG